MKSYVFTVSGADPLSILQSGWFGVRQPAGASWSAAALATFADFTTFEPGHLVFFFADRRIYGCGRIRRLSGSKAAWWCWPDAAVPSASPSSDKVLGEGDVRVAIFFEPWPAIFAGGIDMDELLRDVRARTDWALRYFSNTSFVELESDETTALLEAFSRRFPERTTQPKPVPIPKNLRPFRMADVLTMNDNRYVSTEGAFTSENVMHGILLDSLKEQSNLLGPSLGTQALFHEVAASPAKPAIYVDWLDILRIRGWLPDGNWPHAWDVIECKKDSYDDVNPPKELAAQLMKYVDYFARERAAGFYGAIRGHYVAFSPSDDYLADLQDLAISGFLSRPHVVDPHEPEPLKEWDAVQFWTYRWMENSLRLKEISLTPTA